MRSSTGLYVSKLDHVRAAAAFMVYCWHFVHVHVPFDTVPAFAPLSLFEEGHIGVALFMTLSGYLFAKIVDGRRLDLVGFYCNRLLRLVPLLVVVLGYWALRGDMGLQSFLEGFFIPTWHGGAWSVAVELHFYALFPAILWLQRGNRIGALVALFMAALLMRFGVWAATGSVQAFSYWTIGGCIDLFLAGMLWHELSKLEAVRRRAGGICLTALLTIIAAWHAFNIALDHHPDAAGSHVRSRYRRLRIFARQAASSRRSRFSSGWRSVVFHLPASLRVLPNDREAACSGWFRYGEFSSGTGFRGAHLPDHCRHCDVLVPLHRAAVSATARQLRAPPLPGYARIPSYIRRMKSRLPISRPLWRRIA